MTLDTYKCCNGNKTEWYSMTVREGSKEGTGHSFILYQGRHYWVSYNTKAEWWEGPAIEKVGVQSTQVDRAMLCKGHKARKSLVWSKDKVRLRRLEHSKWEEIGEAGMGSVMWICRPCKELGLFGKM